MEIQLELEPLDCLRGGDHQPFIIAGPCSAESEQQVMETAIQLK